MRGVPTSFHLGPLVFHTYGFGLAIAAYVAYLYARRRLEGRDIEVDSFGPYAIWLIVSGLVGARVANIATNWGYYSGSQWDDTERVPLYDIQPGDLLFYGDDGDQHVAMYVGRGLMIEAPETGQVVHITPIRLGYGFAGLGRVRG